MFELNVCSFYHFVVIVWKKKRKKYILVGTLLAITFNNQTTLKILSQEINPIHILRFIQTYQQQSDQKDANIHLSLRFPKYLWSQAIQFYKKHLIR